MSLLQVSEEEKNLGAVLELIREKKISHMDGRDLYRIIRTESEHFVRCYTVSLNSSSNYAHEHISIDCSSKNFIQEIVNKYTGIHFAQIIFDWFWCPLSWLRAKIHHRFFSDIMIDFATKDILDGSIFLPFNAFFIENIAAHQSVIEEHYNVHLLSEKSKHHSCLWKSTMNIDNETIQQLGKEHNQESIYCCISSDSDLLKSLDGRDISKEDVLEYVRNKIGDDIMNVRIIRLQRKYKKE